MFYLSKSRVKLTYFKVERNNIFTRCYVRVVQNGQQVSTDFTVPSNSKIKNSNKIFVTESWASGCRVLTVCLQPSSCTPLLHPPFPLHHSLLGQLLGFCSRGIVGDYPVWPLHSLCCPLNGANRVAHNPSYIFHRAF